MSVLVKKKLSVLVSKLGWVWKSEGVKLFWYWFYEED